LDVDHKNGDKKDNREINLQTLCANCHRLKTFLNKDWAR
jgi:5-methylcytosine-specific restriction endonuclease McrA